MTGGLSPIQLVATFPLLVAVLAGAIAALGARDADTAFLYRQQHPLQIRARDVEHVVRTAPDPNAKGHPPGRGARCHPEGRRGLWNPWRCSVTYRSGRTSRYRITVRQDGSYVGHYLGGPSRVEGCCVKVPEED